MLPPFTTVFASGLDKFPPISESEQAGHNMSVGLQTLMPRVLRLAQLLSRIRFLPIRRWPCRSAITIALEKKESDVVVYIPTSPAENASVADHPRIAATRKGQPRLRLLQDQKAAMQRTLPCATCVKRDLACNYDAKYSRGRPPTPPLAVAAATTQTLMIHLRPGEAPCLFPPGRRCSAAQQITRT